MKMLLGLMLGLMPTALLADPQLDFPERRLDVPSLTEEAPDDANEPALVPPVSERRDGQKDSRLVSAMPVIKPPQLAWTMPVLEPDRSVEYKLVVKQPAVEPAK
jgi:hypothetical protein